jgi:uncharacterized protein (TIGR02246 family)
MSDDSAVQSVVTAFADAWNRHDPAAFGAVFAQDADFTNVAGEPVHGREKIQAFHAKVFATRFKDSNQTIDRVAIRWVTPEVAAVDVHWTMSGVRDKDGNARPPRTGLISWVVGRSGDQWAVLVMHNQDLGHDAPGTPPAPASAPTP